ncbi:hypothetical protein O181_009271 [Austropuccinia psidii MF-1]|uniref:Uncharacterized protein n=1 Tax=Austropuccinia psidii MF-1 TaxID=1389203 RepID=A0A9Q3GJB6_9BASI|nr:hypothetical protein [Austropuccinia psidii MF-1]
MAKRAPGPKLAKNHILATFNPWPLETTRGPKSFPLNSGEDLSFTNVLRTKGSRNEAYWAHLSQSSPNLNNPKKQPKGPQEPNFGHFEPMASGNHQRPPAQVQKRFP